MNILVLAAHPDDETLGMGGTIARLAQENHEVHLLVMADGETSRSEHQVIRRQEQCKAAAFSLGVKSVSFTTFADQMLDVQPQKVLADTICEAIEFCAPAVVYTHSCHDLNQDHVAVHRATLIATRPQPGCTVKEVYAYEVPSATEWAFGQWGQFSPNVFVDVSGEYCETKYEALAAYVQELRPFPHPRSYASIADAMRRWGSCVGVPAAEAFELIRAVR